MSGILPHEHDMRRAIEPGSRTRVFRSVRW